MNQGFEYREQIGPVEAGRSVLDHLTARYRHSDRATWQARLSAGEVRFDAQPAREDDVLRRGQWLAWHRPPWQEPDVPLSWALLHADDDLIAVAKPRGLPSVPAGGFLEHTLLHQVRRAFPEAAPLHRLGRGTSGLTLFSRRSEARRRLSAAWREGRVAKTYLALVSGVPAQERFSVDTPIGPVAHARLGTVHAATPDGRNARSDVTVLEAREDAALVEVTIATGRPHQIRIHLAAAGHPLVGDPLYVTPGVPGNALPGEGGYRLHALRLAFEHPGTQERTVLECAAPPELRRRS